MQVIHVVGPGRHIEVLIFNFKPVGTGLILRQSLHNIAIELARLASPVREITLELEIGLPQEDLLYHLVIQEIEGYEILVDCYTDGIYAVEMALHVLGFGHQPHETLSVDEEVLDHGDDMACDDEHLVLVHPEHIQVERFVDMNSEAVFIGVVVEKNLFVFAPILERLEDIPLVNTDILMPDYLADLSLPAPRLLPQGDMQSAGVLVALELCVRLLGVHLLFIKDHLDIGYQRIGYLLHL